MQHTITFNLPDDESDLEIYYHAPRIWSFLYDLRHEMRSFVKYGEGRNKNPAQLIELWYGDISNVLDKMEVE